MGVLVEIKINTTTDKRKVKFNLMNAINLFPLRSCGPYPKLIVVASKPTYPMRVFVLMNIDKIYHCSHLGNFGQLSKTNTTNFCPSQLQNCLAYM